jgi:predicted NAD-dependent protein-ADP-ribosyltransferase YbiA (DUF1768 family)
MLVVFKFGIYLFLITLSTAQNVTVDDTSTDIIYNPADAWGHMKVGYTLLNIQRKGLRNPPRRTT